MNERFTDRARKAMQLANQEAQRFNHEYIGTEHILLGLVKEGSGVPARVFKSLGIDLRRIRLEVDKIVQAKPDTLRAGKLPQTPQAMKVVANSVEEARNLNHNYVGTEHLLLGLLGEEEGVGAQVLINLGLTLPVIKDETKKVIAEPGSDAELDLLEACERAEVPAAIPHALRKVEALIQFFVTMKEEAVAGYAMDRAAHLTKLADYLRIMREFLLREVDQNA
jgi:ATP-dependent Clp protease ATP-binding subunit ClpC